LVAYLKLGPPKKVVGPKRGRKREGRVNGRKEKAKKKRQRKGTCIQSHTTEPRGPDGLVQKPRTTFQKSKQKRGARGREERK